MAITGITAFRSILWEDGAWRSSSRKSFTWDNQVVWAECWRTPQCPSDDENHVVISERCSCGIHATLHDKEFRQYMNHPLAVGTLVEALGYIDCQKNGTRHAHTWAHTHGFTSTGVLVVAIVNLTRFAERYGLWETQESNAERRIDQHQFALKKAAYDFGVEIIDYEDARIITQIMWEKHGLEWAKDIPEIGGKNV